MSDRIRNIRARLQGTGAGSPESGDSSAAAAAYIPLVGWAYAYFGKKDDDFCQFHGRQSLRLTAVFLVLYFAVWFLENFWITAFFFGVDSLLHPITRTILYLGIAVYLVASIAAGLRALGGERWEIPYLEEMIDRARNAVRGLFEKDRQE